MAAFGSLFMPEMAITWFDGTAWSSPEVVPSDRLTLHPGAHVLHYSSTCFEGLKAFRHEDGSVKIFRMDKNIERMIQSSRLLGLPTLEADQMAEMITSIVAKYASEVPEPPGSMYIRPTHIGTEPAIGKAAVPSEQSCFYVLLSPVGNYFAGGDKALRLLVDDEGMRCPPHMGMIKSGGNYAGALMPTMKARETYQADQVLFCPDGDIQETGAANFVLIDGDELITKPLDESFLHGVTRDSLLQIARDSGLTVSERNMQVSELLERAKKPGCEAALSGTAAVLAPVGTLIYKGEEYPVGNGQVGEKALKLRERLNAIQWGQAEDCYGWLTDVTPA
ncbi:MAG: branched-chain amino acid aminotransferase [Pontibacterium sp.]